MYKYDVVWGKYIKEDLALWTCDKVPLLQFFIIFHDYECLALNLKLLILLIKEPDWKKFPSWDSTIYPTTKCMLQRAGLSFKVLHIWWFNIYDGAFFAKIIIDFHPLTVLEKKSIIDVWKD